MYMSISYDVTLFSDMKTVHQQAGVKAIDLEEYGKAHPVLAFFKALASNFDGTQLNLGGKTYIVDQESLTKFCNEQNIAKDGDVRTMVSELKKHYLDEVITPIKEGKEADVSEKQFNAAMEALGITNSRELRVSSGQNHVKISDQFKTKLEEELNKADDWKEPRYAKINIRRADPQYREIAEKLSGRKAT